MYMCMCVYVVCKFTCLGEHICVGAYACVLGIGQRLKLDIFLHCSQLYLLIFLLIYFYFIQYIPTTTYPPPTPPHPPISPLFQIHCFSISLEKRASLSVIATEHDIIRWNKSRHKPLRQGWARQPSRKERIPRAYQRVRDTPTSTVRRPTNTPS